uniref:Uncharacterized conserved protein YibQ, putative polysaccharide deacetylase 2 family n=1 Tax=Candidatus Kentrum sp. LFY TaxID=2126342 RepID=A0A450UUX5_9GAMM|nr:MAG: Uncharacterized conserved protein YibQ, putative polysaccharide deacetylase 2 family [Candidatus Kentron sp. LFY]
MCCHQQPISSVNLRHFMETHITVMPQNQPYHVIVLQVIRILLWLVGSFSVISAETQEQENNTLSHSPLRITSDQGPDSSHAELSKRHPEKKHLIGHLPQATPFVSVIVDDLGYRLAEGIRAVNLPGPITLSIIPHTPHAQKLSDLAHRLGKEILLHMPMESKANHYLEPGGLTTRMTRAESIKAVRAGIDSLPHAKGINNHMGSLLTRQKKPMRWLMEAILQHEKNLYFVDSRTTADTIAATTAKQYGIPTLQRDVFLDHEPNANAILAQLHRMVRKARAQGTALGLAHPYPETLDVLKHALPQLEDRGITLVPVSTLLLAKQMRQGQQSAKDTNKPGSSPTQMESSDFIRWVFPWVRCVESASNRVCGDRNTVEQDNPSR